MMKTSCTNASIFSRVSIIPTGLLLLIILYISPIPVLGSTDFYFPHYADGDGCSMLFTFENLGETTAQVDIRIYDSAGSPSTLGFGHKYRSPLLVTLPPQGSLTIKSDGKSNPLKTGYVRVQSEQDEISGVAVFQYAWGGETSVLPVEPSRRFCLPYERSSVMDIGLAMIRPEGVPVQIKLYSEQGHLLAQEFYNPSTIHSGHFSEEIFGPEAPFINGMLVLESEARFAPLGLRFGDSILAGLPVKPFRETCNRSIL